MIVMESGALLCHSDIPVGKLGRWSVERFLVSQQDSEFTSLRAVLKGRGFVPAGMYTKLVRDGTNIVMSDTPDELNDLRGFVGAAKGSVLINGLGLGIAVQAALRKPGVTDVTVIEIEHDITRLVGSHLQDPRLTIISANAFDYRPPRGKRYDVVWHDIWDDICGDNLDEMRTLKRKYARRSGWQGCWCEPETRMAV